MKSIVTALLAVVVMVLSIPNLLAVDREFVIGVEEIEYYPLYDFPRRKSSYIKDVLDLFASKHDYKFTYQPLPIKRLFYRFVKGQLDFKFPDHPGWQTDLKKNSRVMYSDPLIVIVGGTLVLPKNKGRGIDSFKSLGIVLGFTPFHWNTAIKKNKIRIFESSNVRIILKQVLMERVDGADMELSVANYQMEQLNQPNGLVFDPSLPYIVAPYHFSTIKHPVVIDQFNQFLVVEHKAIDRIKLRYGVRDADTVLDLAQQ